MGREPVRLEVVRLCSICGAIFTRLRKNPAPAAEVCPACRASAWRRAKAHARNAIYAVTKWLGWWD